MNQSSMTNIATPTTATAISTVQPLCSLNQNHVFRSDSQSSPSTTSRPSTSQRGVGRKERQVGFASVMSAGDLAIRQRLLELLDATLRNLG